MMEDQDAERLAARLAKFKADTAGDPEVAADLKRLPRLVGEIDRVEAKRLGMYDEQRTIVHRLAGKGLTQSLLGFAAGKSKSWAGKILGPSGRR